MLGQTDYSGSYNIRKTDDETIVSSVPRKLKRRAPRERTIALTDCVCYDSDGNIIQVIPRTATNRKPNRRPNATPTIVNTRNDISLMSAMGSIHEGDV